MVAAHTEVRHERILHATRLIERCAEQHTQLHSTDPIGRLVFFAGLTTAFVEAAASRELVQAGPDHAATPDRCARDIVQQLCAHPDNLWDQLEELAGLTNDRYDQGLFIEDMIEQREMDGLDSALTAAPQTFANVALSKWLLPQLARALPAIEEVASEHRLEDAMLIAATGNVVIQQIVLLPIAQRRSAIKLQRPPSSPRPWPTHWHVMQRGCQPMDANPTTRLRVGPLGALCAGRPRCRARTASVDPICAKRFSDKAKIATCRRVLPCPKTFERRYSVTHCFGQPRFSAKRPMAIKSGRYSKCMVSK